jgi:DNA-binding Lrp family transcriptional regulator
MQAYVLISLQNVDEKKILESIEKHEEIKEAKIVFGEWDIICKVELDSTESLANFILDKIRNLKGIKMTSTLICAK